MERDEKAFGYRLHIPPEWVALFPVAFGMLILCLTILMSNPDRRLQVQTAAVLISLLGLPFWLMARWRPWLGEVCDLALLIGLVAFLAAWRAQPSWLLLLIVPTGLAAVLVSLPVAVGTAVAGTLLSVAWSRVGPAPLDFEFIVSVAVANGSIVALMAVAYIPIRQTVAWAWRFYQQALTVREEAFSRREALEQTMRDLTNANRQLATMSRRTVALRTLAEEAQRTKTMFLAKVSHEFRTPLNMIIGLVGLMVESPQIYAVNLPPDMERDLEVVYRNCRHLASMVDDVLDLTRVESGRLALHPEWICLDEIIEESVSAVRPLVEKKGLALRVELPDSLPKIQCDRTRVRQVVMNLMSNAARFTEAGAITVNVTAKDGYIVTRVIDTGPGIAAEDIASLFEPFSQLSGPIWRDRGGSGLGLSISQQFVSLHGGRLWVESEVGVGSSFNFRLPISQGDGPLARPGHYINEEWVWHEEAFRTEGAGVANDVRNPRVLLVDSTGSLYPGMARFSDAVDILEVRPEVRAISEALVRNPVDVLIVNAPNGDQVPHLLVDRSLPQGTVAVQCSIPSPRKRAAAAGAAGYLIKPVSSESIVKVLQGQGHPVKRVLVVDDEPDICRLFCRLLKLHDNTIDVDTAPNGREASRMVRAKSYDLVLLDLVMPDVDGWAWLREVRAEPKFADMPVYLVSAQDPADEPPATPYLRVTFEGGVSLKQLLRCSLELSRLMMTPESALDPAPRPGPVGRSASTGTLLRPTRAPGPPL